MFSVCVQNVVCLFFWMFTVLTYCIMNIVYFKDWIRGLLGFKNEVEFFVTIWCSNIAYASLCFCVSCMSIPTLFIYCRMCFFQKYLNWSQKKKSNMLLHRLDFQQIIDLWLLDVLILERYRSCIKILNQKNLRSEI